MAVQEVARPEETTSVDGIHHVRWQGKNRCAIFKSATVTGAPLGILRTAPSLQIYLTASLHTWTFGMSRDGLEMSSDPQHSLTLLVQCLQQLYRPEDSASKSLITSSSVSAYRSRRPSIR